MELIGFKVKYNLANGNSDANTAWQLSYITALYFTPASTVGHQLKAFLSAQKGFYMASAMKISEFGGLLKKQITLK